MLLSNAVSSKGAVSKCSEEKSRLFSVKNRRITNHEMISSLELSCLPSGRWRCRPKLKIFFLFFRNKDNTEFRQNPIVPPPKVKHPLLVGLPKENLESAPAIFPNNAHNVLVKQKKRAEQAKIVKFIDQNQNYRSKPEMASHVLMSCCKWTQSTLFWWEAKEHTNKANILRKQAVSSWRMKSDSTRLTPMYLPVFFFFFFSRENRHNNHDEQTPQPGTGHFDTGQTIWQGTFHTCRPPCFPTFTKQKYFFLHLVRLTFPPCALYSSISLSLFLSSLNSSFSLRCNSLTIVRSGNVMWSLTLKKQRRKHKCPSHQLIHKM